MRTNNKTLTYIKIFEIALIGVMMFFVACTNMFNDPINSSQGRIIIDLEQGNARTTFPLMVFDRYEYFFTKTGETVSVEKFPDSDGLFTLDVGNYTVEVLAYTANDTLVARGVSAQFNVIPGSNVIINVPLSSAIPTGQGQLSYTITYPLGTAEVTLQRWSDMSYITLAPVSQGNGISQTVNNLEAGSYLLTIQIIKDELIAGISEAIHIYPSLTTEYRKDFSEKDLLVITISTAAQLNAVRNNLVGRYVLMNNISLSGNWTPIGTSTNPFTGVFDGNGYTISGLTINSTSSNQGLFGRIGSNGIVKNLGLVSVNITSGNDTGGIVGRNDGMVQNCYIIGGIVTRATDILTHNVGGIVGNNSATGRVENCYTTCNVTGKGGNVGGIVGRNDGTVQNSYSTGDIKAESSTDHTRAGGIVGRNDGTVQNCYSTGNVYSSGMLAGERSGVAGGIVGDNNGTVQNSYATGSVFGITLTGGIAGSSIEGSIVRNCVALNPRVLRIEGDYPVLRRVVAGTGGLVSGGSYSNNYGRNGMIVINTAVTTGSHNNQHGANVTTTEAVTAGWWSAPSAGWNALSPWDFNNVWYPANGTRLPTLRNMPGGNTQNPVIQF